MIKNQGEFIRKLDLKEAGLIKQGWDQNVIVGFPIYSKVDLFEPENLKILKAAILKVMKSEEFMRARIVKTGEDRRDKSRQG